MTAASPIFRGILVDTDCRWSVIEAAVDDRTREERGIEPLLNSRHRIPKSRYASVSRFISDRPEMLPEYNDIEAPINQEVFDTLLASGVDSILAHHVAHLFIRDPLVIFRELLQQNNAESSDHFENIQSTNWQTCRFKPPSLTSDLGWRVEFRPMEVQLEDEQNAAFAVYAVLLIRAVMHFNLSLYIPLSLVDFNMARAQKRDAVLEEVFYFRSNITSEEVPSFALRTLADIIAELNGYIRGYLQEMAVEESVLSTLDRYLNFVLDRSTGKSPTPAKIIRNFVTQHPEYKRDSLVSDSIIFDLTKYLAENNK